MSLSNKKISNTEPAATNPNEPEKLVLVELLNPSTSAKFQLLRQEDLPNLGGDYRVLCHADMDTSSLYQKDSFKENGSKPNAIDISDETANAFFQGMEAALNLIGPDADSDQSTEQADKPQDSEQIAVSSQAMDAATDAFFSLMEKNIDRWTYDASSSMLSSLATQKQENVTLQRREAADVQVKSDMLNTEFRAFFIESLVNFNCEEPIRSQSEPQTLELVTSDNWKSHNIEPLLAREYEGQTRVEFSQLNKRLGHILNRTIHPDENVLGPKAFAWTLSQALNACRFTKKQREILEPLIISDFNATLEKLYRHINLIWIGLDILPETKLEILKTDAA